MKIPLMPYVVGVPVQTAVFHGRQDVVAWLLSELKNSSTHSLLLHGSRAIGKTSLLLHLQSLLTDNGYASVYFELKERPLHHLLDDLAQQILEQADLDLSLPESANGFRSQFLPEVQRTLGGSRRLVLLLDNMDLLSGDHDFWTVVPILTGESPPALVFTSSQSPNQLPTKLKFLVKAMPVRRLEPLHDEAAQAVLCQGEARLDFTEEAAAIVLAWSGGHPYLLQMIGRYLWEATDEPIVLGQGFVEEAILSLLNTNGEHFQHLWNGLDLAEQLYTAVLAQIYQPFESMEAIHVMASLEAQTVRLRPHKLKWSIDDLVERGILTSVGDEQYWLTPPLFHAWVKQNQLPVLLKEHLDRLVNPEADKPFQRGREYLLQGQHQKAISYLRQAIGQNPYHVGAQLALGTALLALGFTETAVKRLERAYKLDATEAKQPLAEALVLLAELHLEADARREALNACEQFNSTGSDNPDWQARIRVVEAAVWNQRGDIALQRGFIDKALTAYQNADNRDMIAQLKQSHHQEEPTDELENEAKALVAAENWTEATIIYEKLLGLAQDAGRRASYQKALSQCLEEVELAQYFDEGMKALENENWLLARMSFMHVITKRMNYVRQGKRALSLLDQAAKGHSSTSMLSTLPSPPSTSPLSTPRETLGTGDSLETIPASESPPSVAQESITEPLDSPAPEMPLVPTKNRVGIGGEIVVDLVNKVGNLERLGKGAIVKIAHSPDGKLLALATALGIYFYDTHNLTEVQFIETKIPVQAVAFSPNGQLVVTGSWHETVQVWQIEGGKLVSELEAHHSAVQAVSFSPDGKWIASADEDGVMALWHGDNGQLIRSWATHRGPVTAVTFSPDSRNLLSSSLDKTVGLWAIDGEAQLMSLQKHEEAVTQVVFSHDGQRFLSASRDRTAVLWRLDATGWLRLRRQNAQATMLYSLDSHRRAVNDVAISPDNKLVATASADHIVRLWNADNGTLLHEFKGHVSPVIAVAFSPDGRTLVSATESLVQFWEVETRYSGQAIEGHMGALQSVAVSSDGKLLATAVDTRILIWSLEDQTLRHILLGHTDLVYHITFSPQGNMLASASADRTARLWNVITGLATQTLSGHQGAVMDVGFSPNGQLLATASEAQTIRLWRTTDGKLLQTLTGHQDAVTSVCFNSTGRMLASASSDQTVRLWAIPEGRLQQTLTGHNGIIWQVSFSPDDNLLATAALDRTARLWRVDNGALLHILDAHEGPVWSVQFSFNGQLLISGASDGKVRLWHTPDGTLLRAFEEHTAPVSSVTFTPDGEKLISGSADGTVRVRGIVG